jgi:hypothetical protein
MLLRQANNLVLVFYDLLALFILVCCQWSLFGYLRTKADNFNFIRKTELASHIVIMLLLFHMNFSPTCVEIKKSVVSDAFSLSNFGQRNQTITKNGYILFNYRVVQGDELLLTDFSHFVATRKRDCDVIND